MMKQATTLFTMMMMMIYSSRSCLSTCSAFTTTLPYRHYYPTRHTNTVITTTTSSSSSRSSLLLLFNSLEPIVEDGDWGAYLDSDNTGLVYYFNTVTGESTWEKPYESFPPLPLDDEDDDTFNSRGSSTSGGGFFGLFGGNNKNIVEQEVSIEEEEEIVAEEVVVVEKKSAGSFLGTFQFPSITTSKSNNSNSNTIDKDPIVEEVMTAPKKKKSSSVSGLFSVKKPTAGVIEEAMPTRIKPSLNKISPLSKPLNLSVSAKVLPSPEKIAWGGEDALFFEGRSFGVFDGVSGAEKEEGLPLYSISMANQLKARVGKSGKTMNELTTLLTEVSDVTNLSATGASTALIASIGEDDVLRCLNVGDCRLIVIRDGARISRTKDIVHYFECPYQLAADSPDQPRQGTKLMVELYKGDYVVLGSDGVFDNITDEDVCDIVNNSNGNTSIIAKKVIDQSRAVSLNDQAATPYAKEAKRAGYPNFRNGLGGKVDDISCIAIKCT